MHRYKSKNFNKNTLLLRGQVISNPERIAYTDKTKLVFDMETEMGGVITCVYWSNLNIKQGDEVQVVGWLKDKIFLVEGLLYIRRWSIILNSFQNLPKSKRKDKQIDYFKTRREFNNKFPGKLYICSKCGNLTPDAYYCEECRTQANGIFKDLDNTYKFIIEEESDEVQEIFKPIEL